ncbi:MAG: cell surface protein [Chitinophagaceae bacterium]|nr:cell surface protein [Chitinophagaceae bacterium]
MNFTKQIRLVISCILILSQAHAQYLEFVENKGQWNDNVRFRANMNGGALFIQNTGYKVLLNNPDDVTAIASLIHPHSKDTLHPKRYFDSLQNAGQVVLHSHAYEVKFLNTSKPGSFKAEKQSKQYYNYFIGNDPSKWASGCNPYQSLTVQNLYPNIDIHYYSDNGNLKYDLIVHPGADLSQLAIQFAGPDKLSLKNGNLILKLAFDEVKEMQPYSYQLVNGQKKEVTTSYVLEGNTVKLKLDNYDKNNLLVIDPSVVFSSFTGSSADNWGFTATYDGAGNFYAGGIVFGDGYPVTNGAFQTAYQGGGNGQEPSLSYDIGITKFNPNGQSVIYATYIGGNGNESPHSLVTDAAGNLIIAGRTSSDNYPTTQSPVGPGGNYDIILSKLSSDGKKMLASRKIGGKGVDGANITVNKESTDNTVTLRRNYGDDARSEVILDNAGNICLAAATQSTDFPLVNPVQLGNNGGPHGQDAVVFKITPDLQTPLLSTYLGGKDDDAAFVLAVNPLTNDLYVAGITASTDFPGNHAGTIFPSSQGGVCDGFIAEFSSLGNFVRSTYIGTNGADGIYGIQFDKFGFPYIMGTTTGTWPLKNAAYSNPGSKQFISKLLPDLSDWVYSTVFGKSASQPSISPTAFLVDRCENVYVSGWGGGTLNDAYVPNQSVAGLPVTPDAIQGTTDGADFYFFVMEKDAKKLLYGSFYGQRGGPVSEHVDGGTSRFDKRGVIYQAICANCGANPKPRFPTTPGAAYEDNLASSASGCNLAAIKIAFNFAGVGTAVKSSINGNVGDTSGCLPLKVDFTDTIADAKTYIWDFGDGTKKDTTTGPNDSHVFTQVGNYTVMLVGIDSTTCNITDTSYTHIRVRNDKALVSYTITKVPPCQSLSYQFTNTSIAPANKPFTNQSFTWDFGDNTTATGFNATHTYAAAGTYIVKLKLVDTNYCNAPVVLIDTLRIATNVKADFRTPPSGCAPYTAFFENTSAGGSGFIWDFGDGTSSAQSNPSHTYNIPGIYRVKLIATDPATCNISDSAFVTITVSGSPTAGFTYSPNPPITNVQITFTNNSFNGTVYKWYFGDGDSLITTQHDPAITHSYNETKIYNACLVVVNSFGCADSVCRSIDYKIIPNVDVPNAFTPNGDGINDQVHVKGFGIKNVAWKIYNRWGTLVFQSNNFKQGWDGKYQGQLQPQDVYAYILDVEFVNGEKYVKKGDITLLR